MRAVGMLLGVVCVFPLQIHRHTRKRSYQKKVSQEKFKFHRGISIFPQSLNWREIIMPSVNVNNATKNLMIHKNTWQPWRPKQRLKTWQQSRGSVTSAPNPMDMVVIIFSSAKSVICWVSQKTWKIMILDSNTIDLIILPLANNVSLPILHLHTRTFQYMNYAMQQSPPTRKIQITYAMPAKPKGSKLKSMSHPK